MKSINIIIHIILGIMRVKFVNKYIVRKMILDFYDISEHIISRNMVFKVYLGFFLQKYRATYT